MTQQILPYAVHDKMKQLMLFVQKQRDSQVSDLLLTVLIRTDQIDSLEVSEVNVPSEYVDVQQFAHVFLPVVPVQISVLEFLPDVGELFIDPLLLQFSGSSISKVGNELHEPSHRAAVSC